MASLTRQETLLIIPVYNHAVLLKAVVEKALACDWQVLVVDDGSTDDVDGQISGLACHSISLPENMGKGAAIMAGVSWAAKKDFKAVITIDADGQLNPSEAELLFECARKNWPAVVIGDRLMEQETVPGSSIFGRKFSNFWVRLETGKELPDTQSGFRLYPLTALTENSFSCLRYDFEIEALVRSAWAGYNIFSVPVSVDYPAKDKRISHFHKFKDNFRLTKLHTKLVLRALSPLVHKKTVCSNAPKNGQNISIFAPIKLLKSLCRQHDSTFNLAVAAWLGIFLGALPLIAVHTVVIIYVSHKLHLNKIASVAASQFCAPPVVPVICVQVGYLMRTGSFLTELSWDTLVVQIHQRLWEWFLGSLLVGPLLGLCAAGLTYLAVEKLRKAPRTACDRSPS